MFSTNPARTRPAFGSRAGAGALTGAVAVLMLLVGPVGPAAAHSELVGSTPATGEHLKRPPPQVVFTYNQDVAPQFASTILAVDG